jgi:broad specificity phosphatase PhoE
MGMLVMLRHGQAALGTSNYDQLSDLGVQQAQLAAARLVDADLSVDRVVCGKLRRQRDTAQPLLDRLGREAGSLLVDERLDEYDHIGVLKAHTASVSFEGASGPDANRTIQPALEEAIARWAAADDAGYVESHDAFVDRVVAALDELTQTPGTSVAVTSGGVIAVAYAHVLGLPVQMWPALARVTVNAGITKFISGSTGINALTFNDHAHLESSRSLVTYR